MIKRLRYKLVLIVMAVVTLILAAIFLTMIFTVQRNNERMSVDILHQALNMRAFSIGTQVPPVNSGPSPREGPAPQMRLPVLVMEVDKDGNVAVISNQLHFVEEKDIVPIAEVAANKTENIGILSNYGLRYMQRDLSSGVRIALADITVEQEILKNQITNSLLIGGLAMLAFFFLSLFLARWAVRPVEIAWEQQKQFIANASHELKTPLTVILSNADMLLTEKDLAGDKNARRVEHIHGAGLRMKQLVEDMLALAKSDSGERTTIYSVVDFSYIVKSAVLMYEPIFYDESKELSYDIEDGLAVRGDALRLQQVIHILLDNARKYSSAQGVIRVRLSKAEHKSLLLEVTNQGPPIPKAELRQIFLRFYRRDESRSEHGSFGLGLSIAQSIVSGHKGKIWAESDEISGNSFSVSLPLV